MTERIRRWRGAEPYYYIPTEKAHTQVGRAVHVGWSRNPGVFFILDKVEGDTAYIRTMKTNKRLTTHVAELIYTRNNEETRNDRK